MSQQNQQQERSYSIGSFGEKVKNSQQQLKIKANRKFSQIQNKAYFFEGQLNPITSENKKLKENLISLNKAVSFSTQLLRNLLPVENNPTRKLKLQMATIQQISEMIKQDWQMMKSQLAQLNESNELKAAQIIKLQIKFNSTVAQYDEKIQKIYQQKRQQIEIRDQKIVNLHEEVKEVLEKSEKEKEKIKKQFKQKIEKAEKTEKQFRIFKVQVRQNEIKYERAIQRLKEEIETKVQQFQVSKTNIKQLFSKLMEQKLQQQKQSYQYMIKMKEDEKLGLMIEMEEQSQEFKSQIKQKSSIISHVSGLNDKLKQEVGIKSDNIWKQKLKIDDFIRSVKELGDDLRLEEQNKESLKKKLKDNEQQYFQKESEWKIKQQQKIKEVQEKQKLIKQQQMKMQKERKTLQEKLQGTNEKLEKVKRKLRENIEQYEQNIKNQIDKYTSIIETQKNLRQEVSRKLEREKEKVQNQKQQLIRVENRYKHELSTTIDKFEEDRKNILKSHDNKLINLRAQHYNELNTINRKHQNKLAQIQISNNQYVRNLVLQHNTKQNQAQMKMKQFMEQSQAQINKQKSQLSQIKQSHMKLKSDNQILQENIKKNKREFEAILESQKSILMKQMKEQILNFNKVIQENQQKHEMSMSKLQTEMLKEISLLKQSNCVQQIQQRHMLELNRLKSINQETIFKLESEKESKLKETRQQYERELNFQNIKFNEELKTISTKLQFDITKINEQLLSEQQAHQFTKMERQQKIEYLLHKIGGIKDQMNQKQSNIISLSLTIDRKNEELQKIDEIIEKKMKIAEKKFTEEKEIIIGECENQKNITKHQCKCKVKEVQFQRITHTKEMYQEFNKMKTRHTQQMDSISKRYEELEKLFQERPSRKEDLNKIKELTNVSNQMNKQVKKFQKKMQQANDIVKYLGLQLQNYKDVYDIFGPGGQPTSPNKKGNASFENNEMKEYFMKGIFESTPNESEISIRRYNTEGEDVKLPIIKKYESIEKQQEEDLKNKIRKKSVLIQNFDKSGQIKSNASHFLNLLSTEQKPMVEINPRRGYGRKQLSSKKKKTTILMNKNRLSEKHQIYQQIQH